MPKKLIDLFPSYMTGGGIFANLTGMPWDSDVSDKTMLDIDYFGNHSGLRNLSPLLEKMSCFPDDHILSDVEITRLCNIIKIKFLNSWKREWDVLVDAVYAPLENYDMSEEETPNISRKHSASNDYKDSNTSKTDTNIKVSTNSDVSTEDTGTDVDNKKYGFNSASGVNDTSSHSAGKVNVSGDANSNYTETTGNGNNNKTVVEHTQIGYTEDTETGKRNLTRHGNIGVTTSQQMLLSELELRKTHYFEIVYTDIDTLLTRGSW